MSATNVSQNPVVLQRRLRNLWNTFVAPGDLTTLIVTLVLLMMPALALQAAGWPLSLRIVLPTLTFSVLLGFLLARSRYNEFVALIVSGGYSVIVVLMVAAQVETGSILPGVGDVIVRTIQWGMDAATGGINQDGLVFTLIVALLFWFFGYNAVWHVFRIDRVWRVILPPALILLVNMVVYTGTADLDAYLLIFVFVSLLLVVRSNFDARDWDWYVNGVRVPRHLRNNFMRVGASLALVALLVAWLIPSNNLQEQLDEFQDFLASEPLQEMTEFWSRLIEPVESDGPATTDYYGGDSLNLGGAISLGDQIIFQASAPPEFRYYWRSRVFENYTNQRWLSSANVRISDFTQPLEVNPPQGTTQGRTPVQQRIDIVSPSRLIYAAPQPLSLAVEGRADVSRIDPNGQIVDSSLVNSSDAGLPVNLSVVRPRFVLTEGDSYTATSQLSTASADELRQTSTNYPAWVAPNLSTIGINPRIAALAQQIVVEAGATTPYDQAKALERWLRTNITYNEKISTPPPNVDVIEWFLFEIGEGYCTYYATSMVLMARSLGIPARMAAGFAEGDVDPVTGQYVVRERDAHTWVEVYFPDYGWVEFEPTSAESPLNRDGDDEQPQSGEQQADPAQPQQPTNTPTPLPSPTPLPTSTPEPQSNEAEATPPPDESQPTITPTPTQTATPVIAPTVPPPIVEEEPLPPDLLNSLLQALGFALLILVFAIVIVLLFVFVWWWWEWRGLGGMSPISRAYARLERYLTLIGWRAPDHTTPEERRQQIVEQIPRAERPVSIITRAYIEERYGKIDSGTADSSPYAQASNEAWPEARQNILRRWVRRFMPWRRE